MAQTGYTPIVSYNSSTASAVPSASNLAQGELALNVTDRKIYTKDSGGNVVQVGSGPSATDTLTNKSIGDNLTFTGTGNRITGDFSNATIANRVMFQTSTVNGGTYTGVAPNGTGTGAGYFAYNSSDLSNASQVGFFANGSTDAQFRSTITGTGTYLPMTFYTGGSERMRIDTSGNVGVGFTPRAGQGAFQTYKLVGGGLPAASGTSDPNQVSAINAGGTQLSFGAVVAGHNWIQSRLSSDFAANTNLYLQPNGGNTLHVGPNGGLGYGTGSGGTVTQSTSRTTAVTLNKPTGSITMFTAAGSPTWAAFTVSNSLVSATDIIVLTIRNGATNYYILQASNIQAGSFTINFATGNSGTATDTPVINFAIIKGATS